MTMTMMMITMIITTGIYYEYDYDIYDSDDKDDQDDNDDDDDDDDDDADADEDHEDYEDHEDHKDHDDVTMNRFLIEDSATKRDIVCVGSPGFFPRIVRAQDLH